MNIRFAAVFLSTLLLPACGGGGGGEGPPPPPPPPPPVQTTTVQFDIRDFSGLWLNGSFNTEVRQGNDFFVEVTIDSDELSKLDVRKEGDRLAIGFLPGSDVRASTLEAVVRMPDLGAVELIGSNHVVAAGFSGGVLEISLNGSNVLDARDSGYDYVMAAVSGSSMLELGNVAPITGAHFELSGTTSATVNLMDAATVTGSLSGDSSLLYYGSGINFEMTVASTANITRLGASR